MRVSCTNSYHLILALGAQPGGLSSRRFPQFEPFLRSLLARTSHRPPAVMVALRPRFEQKQALDNVKPASSRVRFHRESPVSLSRIRFEVEVGDVGVDSRQDSDAMFQFSAHY